MCSVHGVTLKAHSKTVITPLERTYYPGPEFDFVTETHLTANKFGRFRKCSLKRE